jgi:endoglucanase
MKKMKKIISVFLTIAMLAGIITVTPLTAAADFKAIPADLTARQLVDRMKTGWNLGNTFDAYNDSHLPGASAGMTTANQVASLETLWLGGSNNATTQTLIKELSNQGFDTIRIPVTWHKAADPGNNWQINSLWMARVKQVVDWAIEEDMYVILNTHHDNRVLNLGSGNASQATHEGNIFVTRIWAQIAEVFKDYDEKLIFASLNEPRHEGGSQEWNGGTVTVRDNVNHLNQVFVNVVRASGGNNENRLLMVPTVAAGSNNNSLNAFRVPLDLPQHRVTMSGNTVGYGNTNISSRKIILAVHTYSPFNWAHDGIGNYGGISTITGDLNRVRDRANVLGLPVILSEWGSVSESEPAGARAQHASDYVFAARERGMVAVWWDNGQGSASSHGFGLIARRRINNAHEIFHPGVIAGIRQGLTRTAATPVISNVTVSHSALAESGGTSTVTITGTNLPFGITVTAAASGAPAITATTTGSAISQTATLVFPANTGGSDRNYNISVSHDSLAAGNAAWRTVRVLRAGGCGGAETIYPLEDATLSTTDAQQRGWNLTLAQFNAATHLDITWTGTIGSVIVILNGGGNNPGWQMTEGVSRGRIALSSLNGYSTLTGLPQLFIANYGSGGFGVVGNVTMSLVAARCGICSDCAPPVNTFSVIYSANGATGGTVPIDTSSPYASGANATVRGNTGNLVRAGGYTFGGWNTAADGSGTAYAAGAAINNITTNIMLFAQWVAVDCGVHVNRKAADCTQCADCPTINLPPCGLNTCQLCCTHDADCSAACSTCNKFIPPCGLNTCQNCCTHDVSCNDTCSICGKSIPFCNICAPCLIAACGAHANRKPADCTQCADCPAIGLPSSCEAAPKCAACQAACSHTVDIIANCTICTVCGKTGLAPSCSDTCVVCTCVHEPSAEATCTTAQVCTVCSHILAAALNHNPGAAATCTVAQTCTRCPHVFVPALGHTYGDWDRVREPTRTAAGRDERVCAACLHIDSRSVPATGGNPQTPPSNPPSSNPPSNLPPPQSTPLPPPPVVIIQQTIDVTNIIVNMPVNIINTININIHVIELVVPAGKTGLTPIEVGREYAGQNAVLVRYDSAARTFEFVTAETIAANGSANLNVEQAGDYLVKTFKTGDVTGTGEVETSDALAVLRHIAGISTLNSVQLFVANGKEGDVNTADALNILRTVAGL